MKKEVILYSRAQCPLCDDAREMLLEINNHYSFNLTEIDISTDDKLIETYDLMIPVVTIDGEEVQYGKINRKVILKYLSEI